jgi:hypothetical protein
MTNKTPSANGGAGAATGPLGELARSFERCGYIRRVNPLRRRRDDQSYKKGYEVRFAVSGEAEAQELQRLLKAVKLRPGKPYPKHQRIVQPVYGRAAVEFIVRLLPKGSKRAALGFAADGKRLTHRTPAARSKGASGSARRYIPSPRSIPCRAAPRQRA